MPGVITSKNAVKIANSKDSDQTAPPGSAVFAQICLSESLRGEDLNTHKAFIVDQGLIVPN